MFTRVDVSTSDPSPNGGGNLGSLAYAGIRRRAQAHMLALAANFSAGSGTLTSTTGSVSPEAYFEELIASMFAWSPPGAGIDAHRTWEALLVRTIPVVLRTTLAPLYADHNLPVAVVDDYNDVTVAGLLTSTAHLTAAQAEKRLPGPHAFAFYWLHLFEAAASQPASHPEPRSVGGIDAG